MIKAVDQHGQPVTIDLADRSQQYYCPICGQTLIQKRGEVRMHHFSHTGLRGVNQNGVEPCSDKWNYDKTDWHINWQKRFPSQYYERILTQGNQKHIADIAVNGIVIEFQHSSISLDEFRERNTFYSSCGYAVIWVFDLIEPFLNGRIAAESNFKYHWAYPKKLFRQLDLQNEQATIYCQLSDEEDDCHAYVMERITSSYRHFSVFYTAEEHVLSIEEFVLYAQTAPEKLLPCHHKVPPMPQLTKSSSTGCTVFELWKPEFSWMVICNINNGNEMLIKGKNGNMFRENRNPHGRIIGRYSNRNKYDGRYHYSEKEYIVWDAEKPIWKMKANSSK